MKPAELRISRELALRLGAIDPETIAEYHEMRRAGLMLLREPETGRPMFWPKVLPTSSS